MDILDFAEVTFMHAVPFSSLLSSAVAPSFYVILSPANFFNKY